MKGVTYTPDSGLMTLNGVPVLVKDSNGYLIIKLAGRYQPQHRVAWKLMTGEWPQAEIDHINRDRADNRWLNLREASKAQNAQNRAAHSNNLLRVRGIRQRKSDGLFEPRIMNKGKAIYLGVYATLEEAVAVRKEAEQRIFSHGSL
jgi:hypothetical protein